MADSFLTTPDAKPGLKADYNEGMRRGQPASGANAAHIVSRTEANVKLTESNLPAEIAAKKTFDVQWSGFLTPTESGDFLAGIRCEGFRRITGDDKQVTTAFGGGGGPASRVGRVHLEKGRKLHSTSRTAAGTGRRIQN